MLALLAIKHLLVRDLSVSFFKSRDNCIKCDRALTTMKGDQSLRGLSSGEYSGGNALRLCVNIGNVKLCIQKDVIKLFHSWRRIYRNANKASRASLFPHRRHPPCQAGFEFSVFAEPVSLHSSISFALGTSDERFSLVCICVYRGCDFLRAAGGIIRVALQLSLILLLLDILAWLLSIARA